MRTFCVWCGNEFVPGPADGAIAHGVCPGCYYALIARRKLDLAELLDQIDVPVIAFDADVTALLANKKAEQAVGKKVDLIKGSPPGPILQCMYASSPEGCGHTIHCSVCTIRLTVTATHQDGQPRRGVEAEQMMEHHGKRQLVRYRISTEKIHDSVLLMIEDIEMLASNPAAGTGR